MLFEFEYVQLRTAILSWLL